MELDRYLRALLDRWYVFVALLGAAVLGTWIYFYFTQKSSAVASVAVLEPAAARAQGGGQQAQINFASVAESLTVSERTVRRLGLDRDGMDGDALRGQVSVKLARTLVPSTSTPLYTVRVSDRRPEMAVQLTNTLIEEARRAFLELNALERSQVDAAVQAEEDRLRQEADQARAALRAFEDTNRIWRINAQIDGQFGLVNGLRQSARLSAAGAPVAVATRNDLTQALTAAESDLARLRALQPEYDRLAFEVSLAGAAVTQLSSRENDVSLVNEPAATAAVRAEVGAARSRLDRAREALAAFQRANGIGDLNAELGTRLGVATELRRQSVTATLPSGSIDEVLANEEAELQRLLALVPQHEELNARLLGVNALISNLEARKFDLVFGASLSPASQVKVLDAARLQSNGFWTLVLYALSIMLSVFAGLVVVYVIAYFDRTPRSVEDVRALFGTPLVVLRLPRAD